LGVSTEAPTTVRGGKNGLKIDSNRLRIRFVFLRGTILDYFCATP
jgi:hypothetical protein